MNNTNFYDSNDKVLLSFVIPCYRSEQTITKVVDEIITTVAEKEKYDYEIIAVNDCSPDCVYDVLTDLANQNKKIKIVNLAKNMGKHSAVLAGYSYASGDYIVNLDDDCQSPVKHLWELLEPVANGGYDVSTAKYTEKKESLWKRIGSQLNFLLSEIMIDKPKGIHFENFSIIKKYIAQELIRYKNPFPYVEGLIYRTTKKIAAIPMEQRERGDEKNTGFTLRKSVALFTNSFTNFSVKPLRIALIIGLFFAIVGFVYGIYIIIRKLIYPDVPLGWSSIMAVLVFSCGIIMLLLGIIGEYIGRIFICINNSPQYVVKNTLNIDEHKIKEFELVNGCTVKDK